MLVEGTRSRHSGDRKVMGKSAFSSRSQRCEAREGSFAMSGVQLATVRSKVIVAIKTAMWIVAWDWGSERGKDRLPIALCQPWGGFARPTGERNRQKRIRSREHQKIMCSIVSILSFPQRGNAVLSTATPSGECVALNRDLICPGAHLRGVIPSLHSQQQIHADVKRLFNA